MEMGRVAGANAVGDSQPYMPQTQGMTMAAMHTSVYSIGDIGIKQDATYKTMEIRDDKKLTLEKYYFLNNALCGVILIGDMSKMKDMTDAVLQKKAFNEIFG